MSTIISAIKRKITSFLPFSTTTNDSLGEDERPNKRQRYDDVVVATPRLLTEPTTSSISKVNLSKEIFNCNTATTTTEHQSDLLQLLNNDILAQCLSYVGTRSDRFSLQVTCKRFQELSNADSMLAIVQLGGDALTVCNFYEEENNDEDNNNEQQGDGEELPLHAANLEEARQRASQSPLTTPPPTTIKGGIILDNDTSITAVKKLIKYAVAGNYEAVYMIAIILCYCYENISEGVAFLRYTADVGNHLPSMYALSLILRDSRSVEADYYLSHACSLNYMPAWQERLTAAEMRARFGDLDAVKLVKYLDSPCLNNLIKRHYLEFKRVRNHPTSHCWNPNCGRWAYKAFGEIEPHHSCHEAFSIESLLPKVSETQSSDKTSKESLDTSPLEQLRKYLRNKTQCRDRHGFKVSRMKMCSSCRRAKYCSKLCQVYDWRSGRHKMECRFLNAE